VVFFVLGDGGAIIIIISLDEEEEAITKTKISCGVAQLVIYY